MYHVLHISSEDADKRGMQGSPSWKNRSLKPQQKSKQSPQFRLNALPVGKCRLCHFYSLLFNTRTSSHRRTFWREACAWQHVGLNSIPQGTPQKFDTNQWAHKTGHSIQNWLLPVDFICTSALVFNCSRCLNINVQAELAVTQATNFRCKKKPPKNTGETNVLRHVPCSGT